MDMIKKYVPLSLFVCLSVKLLLENDFSLNKVIALAIFAGLTGLFEYRLNSKEMKDLTDKVKEIQVLTEAQLKEYKAEIEPLKTRMSSLTMFKSAGGNTNNVR